MTRRFSHLGQQWEVATKGMGFGAGTGRMPKIDQWLVEFRCLSDQSRQPVNGYISRADPSQINEEDLKLSLEEALLVNLLEEKQEALTAGEISAAVGIPIEDVHERAYGLSSKLESWDDNEGIRRYRRA